MNPELEPARPAPAIERGLSVLAATQAENGAWKGDYSGPLFLIPVYVAGLEALGIRPDEATREGFVRYLRAHQNEDGGFGLDVESPSLVFTSVLDYVALRLLGVAADDPALVRARGFFLPRGGPLGSASWGKLVLAVLGLYDYAGLEPIPPELWLLPRRSTFHPSRLWCHCRMVYLPMSWLYGRRARVAERPVLAELRRELYPEPYETIRWEAARGRVSPTDVYTPRSRPLRAALWALRVHERFHSKARRERALEEVLRQLRAEDEATHHVCIGPINKVLNTIVWQLQNPGGPEVRAHLERLGDYLWSGADGLRMNGYNSSELWDTAFAVQAVVATGAPAGTGALLSRAGEYLEQNQVLEDTPEHERFYRHPSRGGFPFSTRDHGWPISDCTGEAVKACLALAPLGLNRVPPERLDAAVAFILSLQNRDGGWATYEPQRGPHWLERLNPSDVFAEIMVDRSWVECTSSCVQALAAYRKSRTATTHVDDAIARGVRYLLDAQRPDGGWEGAWGVCFTYGTWFAVSALRAGGISTRHPALRRAATFLRAHQRADGSWSETIESCRQRQWVQGREGHAVNTSWALLALARCGETESASVAHGVRWLCERQRPDGTWAPEPLAGVFNRTCAIHYDAYLRIFPVWALAVCARRAGTTAPVFH